MNSTHNREPLFVGADTVQYDFGVSRAKAYMIIKELNAELKKARPQAIIVAGKVNRIWYEEACLKTEGR
jgi:hypothetical protein